jgi:potassium/hydrogen antiporter
VDGDIVDYLVGPRSRAAGRRVRELALPEGVVIAVVARDQKMIAPHGNTLIEEGDHVVLVLQPAVRGLVDRVFAGELNGAEKLPPQIEFPLRGTATVGQLQEFYGISVDSRPEATLGAVLRDRLGGGESLVDRAVRFGEITLCVREVAADGTIQRIGMIVGGGGGDESTVAAEATQPARGA